MDGNPKTTIDVRELSAMERHPMIISAFDALSEGQSLILTTDHEPRPLYLRLMQLHEDRFVWEYLETGPLVWRVRIVRC